MKHERTGKFAGVLDLADGIAQRLGRFITLPGASHAHRGALLRQEGGAGVADWIRYGQKNATDTHEWGYVPALAAPGADKFIMWDDSLGNYIFADAVGPAGPAGPPGSLVDVLMLGGM